MAEHSPTPWEVAYEITGENAWDQIGSACFEIRDSNGKPICSIDRDDERVAKHIVRCVNAFREPTAESENSTPVEWLASPVTQDGSGYKILSPAGGVIAITNEQRLQIVRCVNLHEELVKAVGGLLDDIATLCGDADDEGEYDSVRELLAKAKR